MEEGTSWNEVRDFYSDFVGSDWQQNQSTDTYAVWGRGDQEFTIIFTSDAAGDLFVLLILISPEVTVHPPEKKMSKK